MANALRISRRFTRAGVDPFSLVEWDKRHSRITNPDGSVVFEMRGVEVPADWSQVATDIVVSRYFRKAGVPQHDAEGEPVLDESGVPVLGPEQSVKQTIRRLAGCWRDWGERYAYFASTDDAQTFEDELAYMLVRQMASPNSPQWFNTGLDWAYGIKGAPNGFWYVDPESRELVESMSSYERPAPHACFPAGTRVTTRSGSTPIEKLQPGDEVLTHAGRFRPIVDVMQRQVEEPLVRLVLRKLPAAPLVATENHPVLAIRTGGRGRRGVAGMVADWVSAGDLQPGDYVVVANPPSEDIVPAPVDLAVGLGPLFSVTDDVITTRNNGRRPTLRRHLNMNDPSVLRLFGRWLGDGSIGRETRDGERASVNFVFNASDAIGIADVAGLMERTFGVSTPTEYARGQQTAHLRYLRRPLARWFAATFGEGFAGKRIPEFAYDLPRAHRIQLLVGLFLSDGCVQRTDGFLGIHFDHTNRSLAEGVWRIARSLGYAPGFVGGSFRPGGTAPHYRVTISAKDAPELAAACGLAVPAGPANDSALRVGDLLAYRVAAVTRERFFGTVYNLQVAEDESYVAENVVVHNCFIQSVRDDLVNPGGIMDLWVREARLFKFGSGTGTNFSALRAEGEKLSGGGSSSGLMSFLKVGDRAAGAIRSGGTTRRAAKMVILNLDHPDIERFIDWKVEEERKVAALVKAGYSADFNGEAYATVSGQNSNNSIRIPNEFMHALAEGGTWELTSRTTGEVVRTVPARELWDKIASAAWHCADPGVQFDTIINDWHTCPADGRIEATNPCAEFVFLSSQACNLASINLLRFFDQGSRHFDIDAYLHAIRLWTIVLEISVLMAQFPSADIAMGSFTHRTLGLGYANLGSLLMQMGVPYDSDQGRAIMAALTAVLTGEAYATSAEMAAHLGPFEAFERNRESMLRVIRNHRRAAHGADGVEYEELSIPPQVIDAAACPPDMLAAARTAWDRALALGEQHGYRNAQTTVIAPTGCLVGGTFVPTARGLVRLRSLGDPNGEQWQDLGVAVQTDEGPREASRFYVNGAEPVVDVRTKRGYRLRGTPTHRVKVVDATGEWVWKHLADVNAGDLVPLALRQLVGEPQPVPLPPLADAYWTSDHTTFVPRRMTPELAEFVGYFMGDGSLHSRSIRLCVAAEDFDVVDHLVLAGKKMFGLEAVVTAKTGYTEVAFQSVRLVMWWEACGFAKWAPSGHRGKGYRPHIPDSVLHSNDPAVYGAFLRGVFEADGTVTAGHPTWTTATLSFADEVQSLLLALGYPASRRSDTSGWGRNELAVVRLINSTYSDRWLDDVGFISARKNGRVQAGSSPQSGRADRVPVSRPMVDRLLPENVALRRTILMAHARHGAVARRSAEALLEHSDDAELRHLLGFYYDTVASAELGDAELTYDLSVPDNVTYVANGFVSHNTIGLQMDCDTTGVEPDFALVKFKKLAGGGYFKIVNQSVAPALRTLGYSPEQVEDVVRYVVGTNHLEGAPHINRATLRAQGLSDADLDKVDAVLPGVFELRHAMNVFTLGEEALAGLGLSVEEYTSFDFNMLRSLGFTPKEIDEATDHICGHQTIEGAPHLRAEHLAVFDTANRNGRHGKRFIQPQGHIRALGAVAPFLSGSASKTVNLPQEATVADIEDAYMLSYRLGIKCMSVYRDGSKLSQPLSSGGSDDGESDEEESEQAGEALAVEHAVLTGQFPPGTSPAQAYAHSPRPRFLLPARRRGFTQEARVGGHKVFLRTGEYDDGTLGEVFIDLAKEGATLKGILSCFAIAVSKGLQYGVPLDEFVETFTFQNFEPKGMVEGHPNIKMSNSLVDYVFRALGLEYLNRTDLVQVPPGQQPLPGVGEAVEAQARPTPDYDPPVAEAPASREPAHVAPAPTTPSTHGPAQQAGAVPLTLHSLQEQLGTMMGDAPLCDTCGHITVRSGSCYRCLNCGASMGCS